MHFNVIVGAAAGFVASLMPEVLAMAKARFTHQRDLEAKQLELDAAKEGFRYAIDEQARLLAARTPEDAPDCEFLAFVKSSVRPIVTYGFFILFATVKITSMYHAYHIEHLSALQAVPALWDDETETLFAAVLTFWFGSRASKEGTNAQAQARLRTDRDEIEGSGNVSGE